MKSHCLASLTFLLSLCPVPATLAKPKHTPLDKVIKLSDHIVIARFDKIVPDQRQAVRLDIVSTLRGPLKPGPRVVFFEDQPDTRTGEFVAFLDKDLVWRFSATPSKGKKLTEDVLTITGFYDFNAHYVTPGLISLAQLDTLIKTGAFSYRFRGHLHFPAKGKSDLQPSKIEITGSLSAFNDVASVEGLPNVRGFAARPKTSVHTWSGGEMHMHFPLLLDSHLQLMGRLQGLDPASGDYLFRFAAANPVFLTEQSMRQFLADPRRGAPIHTFRLHCPPTKDHPAAQDLTLTLQKEPASLGIVEGWIPRPLEVEATSLNHPSFHSGSSRATLPKRVTDDLGKGDFVLRMVAPTGGGDFLVLAFEFEEPPVDAAPAVDTAPGLVFMRNDLVFRLFTRSLKGTVLVHDGNALRPHRQFTTSFQAATFAR